MFRSSNSGGYGKLSYIVTYNAASDQQDPYFSGALKRGEISVNVQNVNKKCSKLVFKRIFLNDGGNNSLPNWYVIRCQDAFGSIGRDGKASDRVMTLTRDTPGGFWLTYLQERDGGAEIELDKLLNEIRLYLEVPNGDTILNLDRMDFSIEFDLYYYP
jgi:hypothetical protein